MFNSYEDIYYQIAQNIVNAVAEEWDKVSLEVFVFKIDVAVGINGVYSYNGYDKFFNILKSDLENSHVRTSVAFSEIFKKMRKNESDIPWNKCKFILFSGGEFEIEYKFDVDFDWYNNLDCDSDLFDSLDSSVVDQIKSWDGLPSDFDRYWLK